MGATEGTLKTAPLEQNPDNYCTYDGPGPWFTCKPDDVLRPRVAKQGLAGPSTPSTTLVALLEISAEKKKRRSTKEKQNNLKRGSRVPGASTAFLVERPVPRKPFNCAIPESNPIECWASWTYKAYHADVQRVAAGFALLGMKRFECVNIWGFNGPEWHMSALGAMYVGGKCAGLYPSESPETAAFKIVHSGGAILVVDDESRFDHLITALNKREDCTRLKAIITYGFETFSKVDVQIHGLGPIPIICWDTLLEKGSDETDVNEKCAAGLQPGHCASLVYTSGTTGEPKAVMLSHDALIFEATCITHILQDSIGFAGPRIEERILSYLPLSHIAGFILDVVVPLVVQVYFSATMKVLFARPYDLKMKTLGERLRVAKPTLFFGMPKVYEEIADQIKAVDTEVTGFKKTMASMAKNIAVKRSKNVQLGGSGMKPMCYNIAQKIVFNKIRNSIGFDECKVALSGGAPIRVETLEYFASLGLVLNEVYGMSECTGACTFSTYQAHFFGSVGYQIPGVQVKVVSAIIGEANAECPKAPSLDSADKKYQGEICYRGRNIMLGYLANPDMGQKHVDEINNVTSQTIDSEGWLHSGDKGFLTVSGMVKITGRYKEIIVGSGGENIAPVPLEDEIKKQCPGISEVIMLGDHKKFNIALITLKAVGANGECRGTDELDTVAKKINPKITTISEAIEDKAWIAAVTQAVEAANNSKHCQNHNFKIQKFTILPTNFAEEGKELTSTRKLRRKEVEESWSSVIERVYAAEGTGYVMYA